MDFGASFSFVTQDEEWIKKIAIGAVLVLVSPFTLGISLIPLVGWGLEISRRVIRGTEPTLPDWSDFGQLFTDGIKLIVGALIWSLPLIILSICGSIIGVVVAEQGGGDDFAGILSALVSCVSVPYGLLVALLLPSLVGQLADHGEFGRAINPMNAFKLLGANVGGYVLALVVYAIVVPLIQLVGLLVCIVGVLPAYAYGQAVLGHLYGQAYREASANVDLGAAAAA